MALFLDRSRVSNRTIDGANRKKDEEDSNIEQFIINNDDGVRKHPIALVSYLVQYNSRYNPSVTNKMKAILSIILD